MVFAEGRNNSSFEFIQKCIQKSMCVHVQERVRFVLTVQKLFSTSKYIN